MTCACFSRAVLLVRLAGAVTLLGGEACAQGVTVYGRLSPAQMLAGPNHAIRAELGRQVGGNLFHSFGAFGLKQGETATFGGSSSVGNVIGRVTGGAAASINGGINSTIPGANVYLINPNASTLSAAPPEAFGFLSANPRPVMVNGSALQLEPGNTMGLVGSAVTISGGNLQAPGGTVHIASAAGPGEGPVATPGALLLDGGGTTIGASALGTRSGDAGTVNAGTATSQLGVSGQIFIVGPLLNLSGTLAVLASDLRSTAALLREGRAAHGAGPRSSLVVAGRGGQRQGMEATLPALYFAHRPVRDGERRAPQAWTAEASPAPVRTSVSLSSRCG